MGNWGVIIAGLIAAAAALVGYVINQQMTRSERKAKVYAEALRAVREIEELPYRISRRGASNGSTREAIGTVISDAFVSVSFFRAWLQIDSKEVGEAYLLLSKKSISHGEPHRADAWAAPLIATDADANLPEKYRHASDAEWAICMLAMRRELSPWTFLMRSRTRRAIHKLKADAEIALSRDRVHS